MVYLTNYKRICDIKKRNYSIYKNQLENRPLEPVLRVDGPHRVIVNPTNTRDLSSPEIFGPPVWFTYHNMAIHYPDEPTETQKNMMKGVIRGIPIMLPCKSCFMHASEYINSHISNLDLIVSNRNNLFKFFVDFHNMVNERKHKPIISYEEAIRLYT